MPVTLYNIISRNGFVVACWGGYISGHTKKVPDSCLLLWSDRHRQAPCSPRMQASSPHLLQGCGLLWQGGTKFWRFCQTPTKKSLNEFFIMYDVRSLLRDASLYDYTRCKFR